MEFNRAEFWNGILREYSLDTWALYAFFFLIGAAIFFFGDVTRSIKHDDDMPNRFNFWFMLKDNALRFLTVIGATYLAIRFHEAFLGIDSLNEQNCLFHGISFDAVFGKIAKAGLNKVPGVMKARKAHISKINNGG